MHNYFIIGPFEDGMFYVAYKYSFCTVCVPIVQCTSEKSAIEECNRLNSRNIDPLKKG